MNIIKYLAGVWTEVKQGLFTSGVTAFTATAALTSAHVGKALTFNHATVAGTFNLPDVSTLVDGDVIILSNLGVANCSLVRAGTSTIDALGLTAIVSILLQTGESIALVTDGTNWKQLWSVQNSGAVGDGNKYLGVEFIDGTTTLTNAHANKSTIYNGTLVGTSGYPLDSNIVITLPDYTTCAIGDVIDIAILPNVTAVGVSLSISLTGLVMYSGWRLRNGDRIIFVREAGGWDELSNTAFPLDNSRLDLLGAEFDPDATVTDIANKTSISAVDYTNGALVINYNGDNLGYRIQEALYMNSISFFIANRGAVIGVSFGLALSFVGTATIGTVAATVYGQISKVDYLVGTAATNAVAGLVSTVTHVWRKTGADNIVSSWQATIIGAQATGFTATKRFFMGMRALANIPADVLPSSQVNCLGVGYEAGDTRFFFYHNGNSGTCTRIDTGIAVPTVGRANMYKVDIYCCSKKGGLVTLVFSTMDMTTGFYATVARMSIALADTKQPGDGSMLTPVMWASVGGTSSIAGITLVSAYISRNRANAEESVFS